MEFTTEDYGGARLVVPDEPNVLQLINYDSVRYEDSEKGAILNLWEMAKVLITEWESEALPDMNADLSEITDPRAARVIEWAGVTVSAYRRSLDTVSKKLLRAAVSAASNEDKEPPPILSLYWQCMKWGSLPEAGGMNDQDYRTIFLMNVLARVFDAARAWHSKEKMTADQEKTFLWLIDIGVK